MVAEELFNLLDRFSPARYVGLEDAADRLSFLYSVIILMTFSVVVTVRSYVLRPISCYVGTLPSGSDFSSFLENYCWVHGTVAFQEKRLPEDTYLWHKLQAEQGISYYQWVPFIFGLQAVLFYMPRLVWQLYCFNGCGIDLDQLIRQAVLVSEKPFCERQDEYRSLAAVIIDTLYLHRDYRQGKRAQLRRQVLGRFCCLLPSKRFGSKLIFWYLVIKLCYLANALLQLFYLHRFLALDKSLFRLIWHCWIWTGSTLKTVHDDNLLLELEKNRRELQKYFPRMVLCHISQIRHGGMLNDFVAQCVLPVNMLNEKLFFFIWLWLGMVVAVTLLSLLSWLLHTLCLTSRHRLVKKYLKMHRSYDKSNRVTFTRFVNNFLTYDGLFLLKMITKNSGDVVSSHITNEMWLNYLNCYSNLNFRTDSEFKVKIVKKSDFFKTNCVDTKSNEICQDTAPSLTVTPFYL